jgi:hypothetical protein
MPLRSAPMPIPQTSTKISILESDQDVSFGNPHVLSPSILLQFSNRPVAPTLSQKEISLIASGKFNKFINADNLKNFADIRARSI